MKQLVVYSSPGGNTKKLADTVFSRLAGDKDMAAVAQAPDPAGYDMVAVGFWFQAGQPDPASQEYLKKCTGKVFLFATHGAASGSEHAVMGMNKAREMVPGTVIGSFSCPGAVPAKVRETAANKNPQPPWLKDAPAAEGHPNNDDLYALVEAMEKAGLTDPPKAGEKRMFS